MRVGFDASVASGQPGGTGTYAVQLLNALIPMHPDWEFFLYFRRADQPNPLLETPVASNIERRVVSGRLSAWRIQVTMPRQLGRDRIDVYHSPGAFLPLRWPGPKVVTIHDLNIYRHAGNWVRPATLLAWLDLAVQTPLSVRSAARIITPSTAAMNDVRSLLKVGAERVRLIPDAPDPFFESPVQASDIAEARQITGGRRFVLFVGVLSPQKNLRVLIEAFASAVPAASGALLVLAGSDNAGYVPTIRRLARDFGIAERLRLPGYVARSTLRGLYSQAVCLVLPSHGEGFGLPIVEAMACGTPVVAADRQAMPEIVSDAGLLFDPNEPASLAILLRRLWEDEAFRADLSERALKRSRDFSWTGAAEATARVYSEALSGR